MIAPTTPTGSRTTSELPICSSQGKSLAISTTEAVDPAGRPAWIRCDSFLGMPTSREIRSAISSLRAASPSAMAWTYFTRASRSWADQSSNARRAAATAASTSAAVPSGMVPMTSSVEGSTTSIAPVPVEATQAPSM